jgi:4-hydroxybenzoate polyprenyltransferase
MHAGHTGYAEGGLIFLERALFIFAITIPFDVRDIHVDWASGVRTIPQAIGIRPSIYLALSGLCVSALITCLLIFSGVYVQDLWLPYLLCIVVTAILIWYSMQIEDDHYYSGLLDGTMFLLACFYWAWTMIA